MRSRFLLRRCVAAAVTVLVAITLNFVLFRALPGDAVSNLAEVPGASAAFKQELAHEFGLDKPMWAQYTLYVKELADGNLGVSFDNGQPVADNLLVAMRNTVPMVALGLLLSIVLGVLTGVVAAWRRGTAIDHLLSGTALALLSVPTHWLGLMAIVVFAGVLPTGGMTDEFLINPSFWQQLADVLWHMVLPSLTLALSLYGGFALIVRSAMLETLGEDYILSARANGLSDRTILRRHALRNAMLPTSTVIALSLGFLVTGAILVEIVFSWPGIGRTVYQAVLDRDYPMLQGAFLVLTLSVVLINLLADLLYFKLDPRITE